ncbi:centrosomal protein of 164 kDa-like [Rhinichthys klamathensis goyatoka]|uniref:centrosomal protein of 164 kDa-like n=1 Tax=Rhinichthys klamathensis goyatoka TaxID=3034132 RepID=UPI0024B5FFD8|nr:centrosomal protein of 164 kDa-like [Rhinichthys klamathensis goyatoka]
MATTGLRIGDQLVLEEDYDENYIPSEQEINEYAAEIGIDPQREPELLWLAREGMVAPLPDEWKPCQDITGEVYYFNFSTGQSTWDHPCDEQYRQLVVQERERTQHSRTAPPAANAAVGKDKEKEKKKKKDKKKKKEKKKDPEGVRAPGMLAPLAPLRGLSEAPVTPLRGSLGVSSGLQPLKSSLGSVVSSSTAFRSAEEDEEISEEERPLDSVGLLKNLHLDLDALGAGLQYEDSEVSGTVPPEERTEPELQDLGLSRDHSPEPPSEDSLRGRLLPSTAASCPLTSDAAEDQPLIEGMSDGVQEEKQSDEEKSEEIDEQIERFSQTEERTEEQRDQTESEDDENKPREEQEKDSEVQAERSVSCEEEEEERLSEHSEREENKHDTQSDRDSEEIERFQKDSPHIEKGKEQRQEKGEINSEEEVERSVSHMEEEERLSEHGETEEDEHKEEQRESEGCGISDTQSDRDSEEIERFQKDSPQMTHFKTGKFVPQWNPVCSEESEAGEAAAASLSSADDLQAGFHSKLSENVFDLLDLTPAVDRKEEEGEADVDSCVDVSVSADRRLQSQSDVSSPADDISRASHDQRPPTARGRTHTSDQEKRREAQEDEEQRERDEEERRRMEEEKNRLMEEEKTRLMEEEKTRLREEEKTRLREEEKTRLMEEEKNRLMEEEKTRLREEEKNRLREEEKNRLMEEEKNRLMEEEKNRRMEEEKNRLMEEEKKRLMEEEKNRLMEEEKNRLMEEEKRREAQEDEEQHKCDEEEKNRLRLQLLRQALMKDEEDEERRMKEESAEQLRVLKEQILKNRRDEEERLNNDTHTQLQNLRSENEVRLQELRSELEAEQERAETQRRRGLERLREELEEELQAERRRLQDKKEEQLTSIKTQAKLSDSQKNSRSPRPEQPLAEYQRELTDVLQEVREEVERDHRKKLEQLKEEHRHELQNLRETHLERESRERERLLNSLQEERDTLMSTHTTQLHKLQHTLDTQLQEMRRTHSLKETALQEWMEKLEVQTKELQTQEAELQSKASELKKSRQQLCEEEEDIQRGLESLPRLLKERDELHEELQRMRADLQRERQERERQREENSRMMEERHQLETRVTLLQDRCEQLSSRVSELEQSGRAEREEEQQKKSRRKSESGLRLEDLEASVLRSGDASDSSVDQYVVRQYMWNESVSLLRARQFLERQSVQVSDRQAALRAAHSSLKDPSPGTSTQQLYHNLQQEGRDLAELRETLHKGQTLLKEKEEKLNQLETSLTEEVSCEDAERSADRKVTFDVTESEMSSIYSPEGTVPVKVQQLADSLQLISGQLNSVLGALGSLTHKQAPPTLTTPLPPRPSWAWPVNSSPSLSNGLTHRPTDSLQNRWSGLSTGETHTHTHTRHHLQHHLNIISVSTETSRAHMTYSGYTPPSLSSLRPSAEVDGQRLQGLIEGNKRWLEAQRKNRNIPLFPNLRTGSSSAGLVQLSLDDNNQIKVHHY